MRVAFLYNESTEDPALVAEEEQPALSPMVAALRRLGHHVTPIACTLDLSAVRRRLQRAKPDVVLNRVESLGGSDAMMAAIPLLLETMQIAYTGCSSEALASTASKVAVKQRLSRAGLPTPPWITADGICHGWSKAGIHNDLILKSVYEHASFELEDTSIVRSASRARIARVLVQWEADFGKPFFAEQFIEGREFNLSVLGDAPEVLPPAEIDFSAFPAGKPHIVGRRAKCDASAFEYRHTPRRFDFPAADRPLLGRLRELAAACSQLFDLQGYARIDFRCDASGQPWILEINSNPCLSPNAGFAAALAQAGYEYDDAIQRLLDDAILRAGSAIPEARQHRAGRLPQSAKREASTANP